MQPIIIDGCFCWLHIQPDSLGGDTAVLLCPGIRSDALTGYRSFRLLADAMAAAGYPTLRLQYPDTGNSAGLSSTEHWEAWQHSIHRAADWLRDRCGVQHIVLCGLRFGAMLAAAVSAQRSDVAGLILLAPILRGRTYIRQLIIEANLPSIPGKDGFVIGEIALSAETVRRISQAELRHMLPPRGCQVAIYAQSPSPALSECVQQWCTRGVEVACNDFNGLESMLRPTFMNHEPPLTMVRLLDWLSQAIPPSRLASGHPAPVPTVELRTAAWAETR